MFAWLSLLAPIVLEVLKLIFATPSDQRPAVAESVRKRISELYAAVKQSQETEGNTDALEKLINGGH